MKLPFLLSDEAWQGIKPRAADALGMRSDLTAEQRTSLELFRTLDLRAEWACQRTVENRNALVIFGVLLLLLNAGNAAALLRAVLKLMGINLP